MHSGGVTGAGDESIGPSARKERGPQDDRAKDTPVSPVPPVVTELDVFRAFVKAGQRLADIHVHYEKQPEYKLTKAEKEEKNSTIASPK
jgi:predicted helicase